MTNSMLSLGAWIGGTSLAAISGAVTAKSAQQFYGQLDKARWAPPAWLFGPAWSVLYVLMAVAAWRVWSRHGFDGARNEFILYAVQLAFNTAYSWFFFRTAQWAVVHARSQRAAHRRLCHHGRLLAAGSCRRRALRTLCVLGVVRDSAHGLRLASQSDAARIACARLFVSARRRVMVIAGGTGNSTS